MTGQGASNKLNFKQQNEKIENELNVYIKKQTFKYKIDTECKNIFLS